MTRERNKHPDIPKEDRRTLGDRLRDEREYLGFSQEEIATYLAVPRSAVSLIETGQRKVDVLELKKLAGLYKRSISYFTGEEAEDVINADVKYLARKVADLSADDREEVSRFADFLKARKQTKES
jgi:transcriptional regulator with XRE-family HTH domain